MTTAATSSVIQKTVTVSDRSPSRLISESDRYDQKPAARALLIQIALMRMDEDSKYPEDAPQEFKDDKIGWCWLSQFKLGLRVGISESQVHRWIKQFRKDGAIHYRDWRDDNGTLHAEYKINLDYFIAHQRPSQSRDVERPERYAEGTRKATPGSFSTENQPKREQKKPVSITSAKRNPIAEMDEE